MDMNRKALGKRLNRARKERKITSENLSDVLDMSPVYIRQIESGKKIPSLPAFVNIYNTIIDTAVRIYVASVLCIFKSNKTLMLELLIENSGMRNIVF